MKVESVKVTGLSGPDVPQIRDALTAAALQMTTLNVDIAKLEAAVSQYSYVHALTVTSSGAHAVVIHVAEQVPVAYVRPAGSSEVVDADGACLPSSTTVSRRAACGSGRARRSGGSTVSGPGARAAVAVLAAAPYALLAHIASATSSSRARGDRAAAQRPADLLRTGHAAGAEVGGGRGRAAEQGLGRAPPTSMSPIPQRPAAGVGRLAVPGLGARPRVARIHANHQRDRNHRKHVLCRRLNLYLRVSPLKARLSGPDREFADLQRSLREETSR